MWNMLLTKCEHSAKVGTLFLGVKSWKYVECLTKHKNLLWKDVSAQKWQQTYWQNFELKTRKTWKPNIKEVQLIGFINLFFGGRIDQWTLIKRSPRMILNPTDQLFCRISTFNIFGFLLWNWAALSLSWSGWSPGWFIVILVIMVLVKDSPP